MQVKLKAEVLAEPVLVGRERELKKLQLLLESVSEGFCKTVFVAGEAGTGARQLVAEFRQK